MWNNNNNNYTINIVKRKTGIDLKEWKENSINSIKLYCMYKWKQTEELWRLFTMETRVEKEESKIKQNTNKILFMQFLEWQNVESNKQLDQNKMKI